MARTWQLRKENWQIPEMGAIMGILNVTPDSFSDGGQYLSVEAALEHAERLIKEGADIIDIGGESTRPGATPITPEEEQERVLPVLRALRKKRRKIRISIDTRHPSTARAALRSGADIVNDISGLTNPDMLKLCAKHPCGIVLMHMEANPVNMFDPLPPRRFLSVVKEVHHFFTERVAAAEAAGISLSRICLDPGIGFGKNTYENLALIHELESVRVRDLPLLMGLSRKRFIGELAGDRLIAKITYQPTVGMSMLAADNGAEVHRVHDVATHRQALQLRLQELHTPSPRY